MTQNQATQEAALAIVCSFLHDETIADTEMNKLQAISAAAIFLAAGGCSDAPPQWSEVPAAWSSPPQMVRSLAEWNGSLYVGVGRPVAGGGEIYRKETGTLVKRAGFTAQRVTVMMPGPDNALYVGVGTSASGAALFGRYNTDAVNSSGFLSDWTTLGTFPSHAFVYCMTMHDGKVILGLMTNGAGKAEVWQYDGISLTKIGTPGLNGWPSNDPSQGTYELWSHDGVLYASTYGVGNGDGRLYKLAPSGWDNVPIPSTWIPLAMTSYNGKLTIALHNVGNTHANPIVQLDGSTWVPVGDGQPEWANAWLPNHMITGPDGHLYVAFGGDLGTLQVWRYDGEWVKLKSWDGPVAQAINEWFYRIGWHDGKLYAGIAANGGTDGALWEMTP